MPRLGFPPGAGIKGGMMVLFLAFWVVFLAGFVVGWFWVAPTGDRDNDIFYRHR